MDWSRVVGEGEPERVSRPARRIEAAAYGNGRIQLQQQVPPKIDLVYLPAASSESASGRPADVGTFDEAFAAITEPAVKLFGAALPIMRVALGAQLTRSAATQGEANRILVEHIGSTSFDLSNARDFHYQVNRPRKSLLIEGISINRLVKWHEVVWQVMTIEPATGRKFEGTPQPGALLELDINTEAERSTELPAGQLPRLLDELRSLAAEIIERGDVS